MRAAARAPVDEPDVHARAAAADSDHAAAPVSDAERRPRGRVVAARVCVVTRADTRLAIPGGRSPRVLAGRACLGHRGRLAHRSRLVRLPAAAGRGANDGCSWRSRRSGASISGSPGALQDGLRRAVLGKHRTRSGGNQLGTVPPGQMGVERLRRWRSAASKACREGPVRPLVGGSDADARDDLLVRTPVGESDSYLANADLREVTSGSVTCRPSVAGG